MAEDWWERRQFVGVLLDGRENYDEASPEEVDDDTLVIAAPPESFRLRLLFVMQSYGGPSQTRITRLFREADVDASRGGSITCTHAGSEAELHCEADSSATSTVSPADVVAGAATPASSERCRLNSDCPGGEVCRDGHCVVECREDRDCEPGNVCDGYGRCVPEGR